MDAFSPHEHMDAFSLHEQQEQFSNWKKYGAKKETMLPNYLYLGHVLIEY